MLGIADDDLRTMFGQLRPEMTSRVTMAKGERLFSTDDATRGFYRLETGLVRLTRHSADGNEVTLHIARPGETFAEASLFAERYHCDAVADRPSTALIVDKAQMLAALASDPEVARRWIAHLSRQVQTHRTQLALRGLKSAHERVLAFLQTQCTDGSAVIIDRPWKIVATEVGLTHEAFYRALARLEREGRIVRDRDQATVELR